MASSVIMFFIITILSSNILIMAQNSQPKPKAFHIPINKDSKTLQYLATIKLGTPPTTTTAAVDLAGSYLSLPCDPRHVSPSSRQLQCGSAECLAVANNCSARVNDHSKCVVSTPNPFTNDKNKPMSYGTLNDDGVTVTSTDGASYWSRLSYVCVDDPKSHSTAVLGLGTEPHSLPKKLSSDYNLPPKFAHCLPASSGGGSLFVGGGPYTLTLSPEDASRWLSYTPLSGGHVISAKTVKVDKALVKLGQQNPAVKISTTTYHGVLESSVYAAVVGEFRRRNVTRVGPVAPYGACYSTAGVRWTKTGPRVPVIDIELEGNMVNLSWKIYGGNSMVMVSKNVMCLGFIDGGKDNKGNLIVLGGLQIENNLLEFDLTTSRLGFSSSLLPRGVSCSKKI